MVIKTPRRARRVVAAAPRGKPKDKGNSPASIEARPAEQPAEDDGKTETTASGDAAAAPQIERRVAKRWTDALVADGWTAISDFFLANYWRLHLTNSEAMLIVHLMRFKWDKRPPRPAYKTLAKCMRLTTTAVRGHARSLEKKGCLWRVVRRGRPNRFFLDPLFEKLEKLQQVVAEELRREQQHAGDPEDLDWEAVRSRVRIPSGPPAIERRASHGSS